MTSLLSERQRQALRELRRQAEERHQAFHACESGYAGRRQALQEQARAGQESAQQTYVQAKTAAVAEYEAARARHEQHFAQEKTRLESEYGALKKKTNLQFEESTDQAEAQYKENKWTIVTLYESEKKVAKDHFEEAHRLAHENSKKLKAHHQQARERILSWDFVIEFDVDINKENPVPDHDPVFGLNRYTQQSTALLNQLKELRAPQILNGWLPYLLTVLAWLMVCLPGVLFSFWYWWVLGATLIVPAAGWALHRYLTYRTSLFIAQTWEQLCQNYLDAKRLRKLHLTNARDRYREERRQARVLHLAKIRQLLAQYRQHVETLTKRKDQLLAQADKKYQPVLEQLTQQQTVSIEAADQEHREKLADLEKQLKLDTRRLAETLRAQVQANDQRHEGDWQQLDAAWEFTCRHFETEAREIDKECRRCFPAWNDPSWKQWQPAAELPLGLRMGTLAVTTSLIPHADAEDARLARLNLDGISFPALLPFPERASLLFEAGEQGRDQAVEALQAILQWAWTALPAGKMRCTIIDPVSRGESFAAFMHLADHEEALVTSRIWTEQNHIEQRLADLTAHMETVLQKFLRNQFQSLAEYNAQAGEVAEPFRFLVVANFPVNFSTEAARRLISLASAGARCGIYTLVLVDLRQPLPQGIELADLEQACTLLAWEGDRFIWKDADFGDFPLTLDKPPPAEFCTRILSQVGAKAKLANRVEVPFDMIAPTLAESWAADSRAGILVPLGRSGATGRQFLNLGKGTSQHVLIAGKTGSGKSTLLHVLITQLALRYSPWEVELYLIDFKKGVEFKTYAANQLPHARVVAIESEREFGLSVLQRLDAELVRRGEIYRGTGVNDLPGYRQFLDQHNGTGHPAMPRLLLIVDEFQEFFVEDDKVAQEAALLLDRLVRQGRAFGIHIILGSQTLGGAYSLARTTIDQMAVRIALQCSEADAHLILSKENSEARLLSRPGEAIYNAANGLLEGNNLFQTVWLNDDRRDDFLRRARDLAVERNYRPSEPAMIFEGTAPSELARNPWLARLRQGQKPPAPGWHAWIGEAVAIKDPTAAVFRKQSGANVVIIGQNGDMAFRMMVAMLAGLTLQKSDPTTVNFQLCVGQQLEEECEELHAKLGDLLPVKLVPPRDLQATLQALNDELERRQKGAEGEAQFLFLFGLQRFRDLRKGDDDFGFGRKGKDEPASAAKLFQTLTREGPTFGLHTIVWADTLTNLQRSIDRQHLREFEMRVLFQMSAADSSNLMDTPIAAKLGPYRALYFTEEQGKLEKFRPYGLPAAEWWRAGSVSDRSTVELAETGDPSGR